jgi:proline dehydrogenase
LSTARLDRVILFRLATSYWFERVVRSVQYAEAHAWRAASRYVAGTTEDSAVRCARELGERGIGTSLDLFGEQVNDPGLARSTADDYQRLAHRLSELPEQVWLSIDLSHIGLDIDIALCRSLLERIAEALPENRLIQVGAEDAARTDRIFEVILPLARDGARLGATLQANLRRSEQDVERLAEVGLHVRLVKGAYVEAPAVAHPYGEETDLAFVQLAHRLAGTGLPLALATHDRALREALLRALPHAECELLLGVRGEDAERLAREGRTVRLYVPFGQDWFRYWMRRVAESRSA